MPSKFRKDFNEGNKKEQQALLESSDDDDFFLKGPLVPSVFVTNSTPKDSSISRVQSQVHEAVDIMQANIGKVMERGERLEDLQNKSDNLSASTTAFRAKASHLQRSMWWKGCKIRILIGLFIGVILVIIITAVVIQSKNKN